MNISFEAIIFICFSKLIHLSVHNMSNQRNNLKRVKGNKQNATTEDSSFRFV